MVITFFRSHFSGVLRRANLLAIFNLAYFCSILVTALIASYLLPPIAYEAWSPEIFEPLVSSGPVGMAIEIFLFNLIISGFLVVTLPGLIFFPLSAAALLARAVLWGLLLYPLPISVFLVALPTLVFEGEAYVLAAVAGTRVGASWFKPSWLYGGEEGLSRWNALKRTFGEFKRLYFFVILLLFVAAVVEALTIVAF